MANVRAALKQSDLTRYAKAMRNADVAEWRVDVDPATGRHSIVVGKQAPAPSKSDWD